MLNETLGELNVSEREKLVKVKEFLTKKKTAAQQECQLQEGDLDLKRSRPKLLQTEGLTTSATVNERAKVKVRVLDSMVSPNSHSSNSSSITAMLTSSVR